MIIEHRGRKLQVPDEVQGDEQALSNWLGDIDADIDAADSAERTTVSAGQRFEDARVTDESLGGYGETYNDVRNTLADVPFVGGIPEFIFGSETRPSQLQAMGNEFMRNYLIDAPANVAGLTQPEYGGTQDFAEQRDAHREATDMFTSASGLPGWMDDAASLAGVLTGLPQKGLAKLVNMVRGPGTAKAGTRVAAATGAGALEGAAAGALESEKAELGDILMDAFVNSVIGGGVGGGVQGASEVMGGGWRGMYADEDSASRYATQKEAGLQPTTGSVGNPNAAMVENTLRDAPMSPARFLRLPNVLERQGYNQAQIDEMFTNARANVSPAAPLAKESDFSEGARTAVTDTRKGLQQEMSNTGEELIERVGEDTPVKVRQVEEVPSNLARQKYDMAISDYANEDIKGLTRNRQIGGPVNDNLNQVYGARFRTLNTEKKRLEKAIADNRARQKHLRQKGRARQADRLQTRISAPDGLRKQLGDVKQQLKITQRRSKANMGTPFRATQNWRTGVGKRAAATDGLANFQKDMLYAPVTRAMEDASPEFAPLNDKLRELYGDDAVLGKWFGDRTSYSTMLPKLFKDGQTEVLDVIERRMDSETWDQLRGSVIHRMGLQNVKGQNSFSDVQFANEWNKLGDTAKDRLAGTPEKRALFDAITNVTGTLGELRTNQNFSRSGTSGGILATLAVKSVTAAKFLARLGVADVAMSSEALAKATAGEPTDLMRLVQNALIASETRGPDKDDPDNTRFPETRDSLRELAQ